MMITPLSPWGREKILLATDASEFSAGAEREAIQLARTLNSHLSITSVVNASPEEDAVALQHLIKQAENKAYSYLETVKSKAVEANVESEIQLCRGESPYEAIVETAEEQQVDLIVMGRRGKSGLMRLMMGSSTAKVIGLANCNILVTPREAEIKGKNFLLAVDGSRYSEKAAATVVKLAQGFNAKVTVISVVYTSHKEERRKEAEAVIERITAFLQEQGISVESQIVTGRYAETIVKTAEDIGCDLIVVGSHGRTGLEKLLVGSVSERVIGLAECAVLVVKA
ncbi:MAG TPA: universal stress protein [Thiotrichaceae bacterium]|nr:universal stress protein [Thiotrichaceae bacterium]